MRIFFAFLCFSWASLAGSENATFRVNGIRASQLLDHDFLSRYPVENVTINAIETLNTVALCNGVVIEEATIDQLQGYMAEGKLSSVQLTACCMDRVFQVERYIK